MKRWLRTDVLAGLMFAVFSLWGFIASSGLDIGTPTSMGPGYFPRLLSGLMLALGLAIAIGGLVSAEPASPAAWTLKPIGLVSIACIAFAALLSRGGIVLAIVTAVAIGAFAGNRAEIRHLVVLTIVLVAAAVALFVWLLGVPLPIWPRLSV